MKQRKWLLGAEDWKPSKYVAQTIDVGCLWVRRLEHQGSQWAPYNQKVFIQPIGSWPCKGVSEEFTTNRFLLKNNCMCYGEEENLVTETHREMTMWLQRQRIGVMQWQAKEWWRSKATARSKKDAMKDSPQCDRGTMALRTTWYWTSSLQNHEGINFCCFKQYSFW